MSEEATGIKSEFPTITDDRTIISRYVGRKFVGFLTSTALLCYHLIDPDIWKFTFVIYCAADLFEKVAPYIFQKRGA